MKPYKLAHEEKKSEARKKTFLPHFSMNEPEINVKNWIVFYPIYINSKKTIAEGRRINASKACEDPTCDEIASVCKDHLNLPCRVEENKAYPRDYMQIGRVRVLLKKEDGALCNPDVGSRKILMLRVSELLSKKHELASRTKKQEPASTSAMETKKSGRKAGKKRR